MVILKFLFVLLILLFPLAEVGRVQILEGIAISVNDIILFFVIVSWILFMIRNKKPFFAGYLKKPLMLFICVTIISLVVNIYRLTPLTFFVSLLYLLRWGGYALIYFIVNSFDSKFKQKLQYLFLFSGFVVVFVGYIQYFLYPSLRNLYYLGWDEHLYRMFSTFLDPNFAGAFFVIYLLFTINFLRNKIIWQNIFNKICILLLSLLTLGAIYLTYSRSAFLMLLISAFIYMFFLLKKRFIILSLSILVLLIFIAPKSFKTEGTNFLRTASVEARLQSFDVGVKIFTDNPVLGVGFNAYRYAQNKYGLVGQLWQTTHSGAGTDNSFIFVLATTGVIGFSSFLFLIYKLFLLSRNNIKKSKYSLVLLSVLVALVVDSFFVNSLFYVLILEWVWILASFTESN